MLNRQEICAALGVSESTIRRLEQQGLPFTPVGARSKRYDLAECKAWLRENPPSTERSEPFTPTQKPTVEQRKPSQQFEQECRKIRIRVGPS